MSYQTILYVKKDGVVTITLNIPEKFNCMNDILIHELRNAIHETETDDSVGAVVLTGAGRAFCAGGDISEMVEKNYTTVTGYQHMKEYHRFTSELINLKKPVIAAVNGVAVGGGFSLALLCDVIIASETAKFRSVFMNIALVPDLALIYHLTKMLGAQKAKELVFTDRIIEPEEACRLGFVSKVVSNEDLQEEAFQFARKLANGPRVMLQYTKSMINMAAENSIATMLEIEARAQAECFMTEDHKIACNAFLNKTKPIYIGK